MPSHFRPLPTLDQYKAAQAGRHDKKPRVKLHNAAEATTEENEAEGEALLSHAPGMTGDEEEEEEGEWEISRPLPSTPTPNPCLIDERTPAEFHLPPVLQALDMPAVVSTAASVPGLPTGTALKEVREAVVRKIFKDNRKGLLKLLKAQRRRDHVQRAKLARLKTWLREEDMEGWMRAKNLQPAHRVTVRQKAELKRWFDVLDADHSGEVSLAELEDPLMSVGLTQSTQEVMKLIKAVDEDGSGAIGFEEFLTVVLTAGKLMQPTDADGRKGGSRSTTRRVTPASASTDTPGTTSPTSIDIGVRVAPAGDNTHTHAAAHTRTPSNGGASGRVLPLAVQFSSTPAGEGVSASPLDDRQEKRKRKRRSSSLSVDPTTQRAAHVGQGATPHHHTPQHQTPQRHTQQHQQHTGPFSVSVNFDDTSHRSLGSTSLLGSTSPHSDGSVTKRSTRRSTLRSSLRRSMPARPKAFLRGVRVDEDHEMNPLLELQAYHKQTGLSDFTLAINIRRRKLLLRAMVEGTKSCAGMLEVQKQIAAAKERDEHSLARNLKRREVELQRSHHQTQNYITNMSKVLQQKGFLPPPPSHPTRRKAMFPVDSFTAASATQGDGVARTSSPMFLSTPGRASMTDDAGYSDEWDRSPTPPVVRELRASLQPAITLRVH